MTRALALALLTLTLLAAPAGAAPTIGSGARTATRSAGATTHHSPAKPHAAVAGATADSAAMAAGKASARTLEDIHIEGEIPVPQVLFITAREQRRFMEFQHHRYIKSSRDVGAATAPPTRIVMSRAQTPPERSHTDD
jgi:hypothetical protein